MLILPIKKKWFDMIKSGKKTEEYREIKPYWTDRFFNPKNGLRKTIFFNDCSLKNGRAFLRGKIIFRNGYEKTSPQFIAEVLIRIRTGKKKWGAEPKKKYYVLEILSKEEI